MEEKKVQIQRTAGGASISLPRKPIVPAVRPQLPPRPTPSGNRPKPMMPQRPGMQQRQAMQQQGKPSVRPIMPSGNKPLPRLVVQPVRPVQQQRPNQAPAAGQGAQQPTSLFPKSGKSAHRLVADLGERRDKPGIRQTDVIVQQKTAAPKTPKVKAYPIGGLEEIGRNCMVFECGDDIVIVDAGMMFPEEGMPGIDYIIPDVSSLRGKEKNIRAVILTHGHLDHIGGIPHIIGKLGWPLILTAPLTAGLVRKRQEEYGNAKQLKIQLVTSATKVQLGTNFTFEPFHVNHNISDAFGVALHTPYGTIIMTGDFKFDFTPVNDEPADLTHIAMFGARGVLALMSDSTNAESPGYQMSESVVGLEVEKIFQNHKGRLVIGTFSSMLTRAQQIIWLCEKYGRKLLIEGRSMRDNIDLTHQLGYMTIKPGTIIEENEARRTPNEKLCILCTGSQGEKNAVLMRMANAEHRHLRIEPGDGIVFSSSVIPGNERTIQSLKDTFVRQGAKVYHNQNLDIHAGGHAKQEDLKMMLRLMKPKYFMPVHGNRFLLEAHAGLAEIVGIPRSNIFVAENGQVVEFGNEGARLTDERHPIEYVMVDGLGVGDVSDVVIRDRLALAADGVFLIVVTIDRKTGELVGQPDLISRGFTYMKDNRELIEKSRLKIKKILKDNDKKSPAFEEHLRNKLRNDMGQFLFQMTQRRPMILPVIVEV